MIIFCIFLIWQQNKSTCLTGNCCKNYEHFLIMDNFNDNISEPTQTYFFTFFKLNNFVEEPICDKNQNNPSLCLIIPSLIILKRQLFIQLIK